MGMFIKHGAQMALMSLFATMGAFATNAQAPEEACATYLATQKNVTTMGGDTYDLSTQDAHQAFLTSTDSIHFGVSAHLLGDLQGDTSAGSGVKRVGRKLGELLRDGTPLESIRADQVLGEKDKIDFFKGALNYVINTFLWNKGAQKTTEVTAPEVASAYCVRTRLLNAKKNLG